MINKRIKKTALKIAGLFFGSILPGFYALALVLHYFGYGVLPKYILEFEDSRALFQKILILLLISVCYLLIWSRTNLTVNNGLSLKSTRAEFNYKLLVNTLLASCIFYLVMSLPDFIMLSYGYLFTGAQNYFIFIYSPIILKPFILILVPLLLVDKDIKKISAKLMGIIFLILLTMYYLIPDLHSRKFSQTTQRILFTANLEPKHYEPVVAIGCNTIPIYFEGSENKHNPNGSLKFSGFGFNSGRGFTLSLLLPENGMSNEAVIKEIHSALKMSHCLNYEIKSFTRKLINEWK